MDYREVKHNRRLFGNNQTVYNLLPRPRGQEDVFGASDGGLTFEIQNVVEVDGFFSPEVDHFRVAVRGTDKAAVRPRGGGAAAYSGIKRGHSLPAGAIFS